MLRFIRPLLGAALAALVAACTGPAGGTAATAGPSPSPVDSRGCGAHVVGTVDVR